VSRVYWTREENRLHLCFRLQPFVFHPAAAAIHFTADGHVFEPSQQQNDLHAQVPGDTHPTQRQIRTRPTTLTPSDWTVCWSISLTPARNPKPSLRLQPVARSRNHPRGHVAIGHHQVAAACIVAVGAVSRHHPDPVRRRFRLGKIRSDRTLMSIAISESITASDSRNRRDTSRVVGNGSLLSTSTRL